MIALLALFFAPPAAESANDIMARVAENQDRAQALRTSFVYHQNVLVRVLYANGKLDNDEMSDYVVTPTPAGQHRERVAFVGHHMEHGKRVEFHHADEDDSHIHINFHDDDSSGSDDKDGVERDMFPLTAKHQKEFVFHLEGAEGYRGTPVYHITFQPRDGAWDWSGDVLVDRNEYQPVVVTTYLAKKIPFLVRTALGTNLEHLGFKVTYKKFGDGIWFPVTYGGEFRFRAIFFFARKVGISVQNSDFRRADVSTRVQYDKID